MVSLKDFLMDRGYAEELVDSILEDPINNIVEAVVGEDDEAMMEDMNVEDVNVEDVNVEDGMVEAV